MLNIPFGLALIDTLDLIEEAFSKKTRVLFQFRFKTSTLWLIVSLAAVLCLVTQRSSPQTAAHIRTTFLSHCFCGLMKGPIMYQQIENDVSIRAKKDNGTSGRSFNY